MISSGLAIPSSVVSGNAVAFPVAPLAWEDVNRRVAPGAGRAR